MRAFRTRHWVAATVAVVAFVVLAAALFQPPADGAAPASHHHGGSLDPVTATALGANVIALLVIAVLELRRRHRR